MHNLKSPIHAASDIIAFLYPFVKPIFQFFCLFLPSGTAFFLDRFILRLLYCIEINYTRFSVKKRLLSFLLFLCILLPFAQLIASAYNHSETTPLPDGLYKKWKQTDSRWSDIVIGVDPWADSSGVKHKYETVGHAGCLITSMAILAKGYGLLLKDGTSINPGTLSAMLYDDGSLTYLKSGGACLYKTAFDETIPGIHYVDTVYPNGQADTVTKYLSDTEHEYIMIACVKSGGHYVAIDYVDGKKVYICDPGYEDRDLLSVYTVSLFLLYEVDPEYINIQNTIESAPMWKVTEKDGLRIRSKPSLSSTKTGLYQKDTVLEVSETVEADGYLWGKTIDGWCALRSLNMKDIFCEAISVTQYPVSYHANGGTDAPETQYKAEGSALTLTDRIPKFEGNLFLGWSSDPSAVSAEYAPGGSYETDEPLVLYAVWMSNESIFGFGIDASSYQKTVDWNEVAKHNISFVILRAGTTKGKDDYFESNYENATKAGLHVGCYFYSYALTEKALKTDIDHYLSYIKGKKFDMPVYLDIESTDQSKLSPTVLNGFVQTYMQIMEEHNYFPGVYSSESWFIKRLDPILCGGKEHLWVAKWMASKTLTQNMSESFGMYQYSDYGYIDGIPGRVDLDVCYLDYPSIIRDTEQNGYQSISLREDAVIKSDGKVFYGGAPGMTAADWKSQFDSDVTILSPSGNVMNPEDIVYTGCQITVGKLDGYIAVRGDINGDGQVNSKDYMMLKRMVLGTFTTSATSYYAGCIDGGTSINTKCYTMLKRHVLGTYNIYA